MGNLSGINRVPMGRTLRKRMVKVEKHLKRGAMIRKRKVSEKESSGFLQISNSRRLIIFTDCGSSSERQGRNKKHQENVL